MMSQSRKALLLVTISYLLTPIVTYHGRYHGGLGVNVNLLGGGGPEGPGPQVGPPPEGPGPQVGPQDVSGGHTVAPLAGCPFDAFSASFSTPVHLVDNLYHYRANDPIKFDTAEVNIKNGFNPQSGSFIASVPGYYSCGLSTYSTTELVIIKKSPAHVGGVCAAQVHPSTHHLSPAACTALVKLKAGDEVYVIAQHNGQAFVPWVRPGYLQIPFITFHCHMIKATRQ